MDEENGLARFLFCTVFLGGVTRLSAFINIAEGFGSPLFFLLPLVCCNVLLSFPS